MTDRVRVYPDESAGPFEPPPLTVEDDEGRAVDVGAVGTDALEDLVEMYLTFDPADRAQGIPPIGEQRVREWVEYLLEEGINVAAYHGDRAVGHATLVPDEPSGDASGGDPDRPDRGADRPDRGVDDPGGDSEPGTVPHELAIFVLGEYQGAGIGTDLLKTLLGEGVRRGIERVWLTVEPWNHAAIHLYEKVGFEPSGMGSFEREYAIRLA